MAEEKEKKVDKVTDVWAPESVKAEILAVVKNVAEILVDKNRKYGNAALQPKRIFSRTNLIEQLNVRIDDKLSRIANQQEDEDEDAELDLVGYLILKRVCKNLAEKEKHDNI